MPTLYVIYSSRFQKSGAAAGLDGTLCKVGFTDRSVFERWPEHNAESLAGFDDWELVFHCNIDEAHDDESVQALAKQKLFWIDPERFPDLTSGVTELFAAQHIDLDQIIFNDGIAMIRLETHCKQLFADISLDE